MVLAPWKPSLLESAAPLLDARDRGVAIAVDPVRVAFALAAGGALALESGSPGLDAGRLRVAMHPGELAQLVGELRAAASDAVVEAEHALFLALGELVWTDSTGVTRQSPLALWPVELAIEEDVARLVPSGVPRANDALVERLAAEHGLALPIDGALDLAALLDAAAAAAELREGWYVERIARLAAWSFAKLDLWKDLEALAEVPSGALALIAGDATAAALPAAFSDDVVAPLPADRSQLHAIAAAGGGGSFVVCGAPGTGKTQTIANVIAHCTAAGKTVLVVSDRRGPLDTIRERLGSLGEFCLPLYGEHATRARVVEMLARVLERAFRPGSGPNAQARLAELRALLDRHAAALHAPTALGTSVHEVLARLVELRTTPNAALAERDAAMLDAKGFAYRRAAIDALAEAARAVEPVAQHPWRSASPDSWPDGAGERAARALDDASAAVEALAAALAEVGALVPGLVAKTPEQIRALGVLADLAAVSPRPGAELLTMLRGGRADEAGERVALIRARGAGTLDAPRDPAELIAIAQRHRALVQEVNESFTESVESLDAGELWAQLKRWTSSMAPLRFVALRAARAQVRAAARPDALLTDEAMLVALEAVIAERACREALRAADGPARRWLGELYAAPVDWTSPSGEAAGLDIARIEAAGAWAIELRRAFDRLAVDHNSAALRAAARPGEAGAFDRNSAALRAAARPGEAGAFDRGESGRHAAWRALVAQVAASSDGGDLLAFARLADAVGRWEHALGELAAATGVAKTELGVGEDHVAALREQLATWRATVDDLPAWARFHLARHAARVAGIGPALDAIARGDLAAADLAAAWQRATLLAWLDAELRATPALAGFDGAAHHARTGEYADLDRRSFAVATSRALARLAERVPRVIGASDVDPPIAALRRERAVEHGKSIHDILVETRELFPRLAPCVLATPASLARHLDPALAFDVVVFDDASRIPLAHALGALARGRACVIVGDPRQPAPADEGLLERALGAGLPALELGVHYRSQHDELFAFANAQWYRDRIEVAPAARREAAIAWRRIEGACDETGVNRAEAEAIAADLPSFEGKSIAIVAMSRAQAELIESMVPPEVLVGTPDRLQGEERDVTLISIGGTPDALGALALPGGERWLDVAITRARHKWIAFSSFAPEDIAVDAPAPARELAALLAFARDRAGSPACEDAPASPITAAIGRALVERGWTVRHRVGSGPYRVELAVVDPEDPARYVLAIEHDGATYLDARSARDRDRARAELLAQRGWRVHRIWSLDWWRDAEREIQRAHGAIVAAVAAHRRAVAIEARREEPRTRTARGSAPMPAPMIDTLPVSTETSLALANTGELEAPLASGSGPSQVVAEVTAPVVRIARGAIAIGPYIAAAIPAGRRTPEDMFAARHAAEVGKIVEQVLAAEAPIHLELLARRVAAYFGIGKIDARVVEQVRLALAGRGRFGDEHGIVWRSDQDPASVPGVRVAGNTAAARRDIAEVPLSELAAAARVVVERAHDLGAAELVRGCARLLGYARITDQVTERVALGVQLAAARQLIALADGRAKLPS